MTGCMLSSLKVVRIAAVCWACTSLSAIRERSRDIGSRRSLRSAPPPAGGAGAFAGSGAFVCFGSGFSAAAAFCVSMNSSTSPLVSLPPLPVPLIFEGSRSFSSTSLRTAGLSETLAVAVPSGRAVGAAVSWTGSAFTSGLASLTLPSGSIRAITSWLSAISPLFLRIWASTPPSGAGTSSTTLSVSSSMRISSRSTESPSPFFQSSRVASGMDSDSTGTLTSTLTLELPRMHSAAWTSVNAGQACREFP